MISPDFAAEQEEWGSDVAESPSAGEAGLVEPGPASVDHVVDLYRCYPGELVTFYTRLTVHEPLSDLTLRVSLPEGLALGDYFPPPQRANVMPHSEVDNGTHYLVWPLEGELEPGTQFEYQAQARVAPTHWDATYESRATVTGSDFTTLAQEAVSISVAAKGRYLRYLPAIYEGDELMGRFLMLFESFWAPVEQQIESIPYYFDPRTAPASFLPWLASWLDLKLDERWPEARLRRLIRWAIALHRSRGTKWGLLKYLEIYTGQRAEIVEHRSKNFILGKESRLGPGIALGRGNLPHTFTVTLQLPAIDAEDKEERDRLERLRLRTIESIIEMQKPAHTVYDLNLEILSPEELAAQTKQADTQAEEKEEAVDEIAAQAAVWFKLDDEPQDAEPSGKQNSKDRNGKSSKGKGEK